MLPESPYIGKLIESFDEENVKILVLKLINGKEFQSCLWTQTKQDKIQTAKSGHLTKTKMLFSKEQVVKWTLQMA